MADPPRPGALHSCHPIAPQGYKDELFVAGDAEELQVQIRCRRLCTPLPSGSKDRVASSRHVLHRDPDNWSQSVTWVTWLDDVVVTQGIRTPTRVQISVKLIRVIRVIRVFRVIIIIPFRTLLSQLAVLPVQGALVVVRQRTLQTA